MVIWNSVCVSVRAGVRVCVYIIIMIIFIDSYKTYISLYDFQWGKLLTFWRTDSYINKEGSLRVSRYTFEEFYFENVVSAYIVIMIMY